MKRKSILKGSLFFSLLLCLPCQMKGSSVMDVRINEVMSANVDLFVDPSWNYGGWIEIYNPTESRLNLRGCWISDDPNNLKKIHVSQSTSIPAGGFANLWFDHHDRMCPSQMNMKLDCDGGTIYLSSSTGKLIDQIEYPAAVARNSYARKVDGTGEWGWTSTPTPAASNAESDFGEERLPAPEPDCDSQIFSRSFTATVPIPKGATLRYTIDGTTPTLENGYTSDTGAFLVAKTRIYRFAFFQSGFLSSPVVTRSYIRKDKEFSLPIVSVVTDPDNLYNAKLGVFTKGINGRAGKGTSERCNWNMDWDRPVNFEYMSAEGKLLCNQEADLSRCGGHSKGFTPYAFKLVAKKQFEGKNSFDCQFFADKPFLKHKGLQLRGGANDYMCRMTDVCLQSIVRTSGIDIDLQDYQPVCHYINGVYKGTINMREPNNKHNVYANHGLDDDEIDMFEIECDSCYVQMCGTDAAWKELKSLSTNASSAATYEKIKNLLDVDELCNYLACEMFLCNNDWPQNNQKGWRPIADNGKFRFILYDLDLTFGNSNPFSTFESRQWYTFCELFDVPGVSHFTREVEIVPIFLNLLNNATFRKKFIDTFSIVAGSIFTPSRCEEIIRKIASTVYPMQILDDNGYNRNVSPWGTANTLISQLNANHQNAMYNCLKSYGRFKLSGVKSQAIKLSKNIEQAQLQANEQVIPTGAFDGQLFPPMTLRASAPAGYKFQGWKLLSGDVDAEAVKLVENGATWRYYDKGSLDGKTWKKASFSVSTWPSGAAPFGYANYDLGIVTKLNYGEDANNKYPTYYFRRSFTMSEAPSERASITLNYTMDDGFIIYVNGEEAGRMNMPSGEANFNTYTTSSASTEPLSGSLKLKPSLFKKGSNVVAVEIHNVNAGSTDIFWDCNISMVEPKEDDPDVQYYSTDESIELPTSASKLELQACYKAIPDEEREGQGKVVINEVSADNSIFVNEYYKKSDWIELYNMSSKDMNLDGMFLSDDINNPKKFRITSEGSTINTIIPAGGYRIIWCDKQAADSQLHAPFKLANEENAYVVLTASNEAWADTLVYCAHEGNESVGRFPDGGKDVYKMTNPSISKPNTMNTYTKEWKATFKPEGDGIEKVMASRSGGMSIIPSQDMLKVKSEEDPDITLDISTLNGSLVMSQKLHLETGHTQVSISLLAPGTYVAQIRDSEGNKCGTKFTKK